MRNYLLCYAAGGIGGLLNSLALWLCGLYGITAAIGVNISPALSPEWLYPRLVWGGLWGLLFALPLFTGPWLRRALLLSLLPSAVQLFIVFPYHSPYGQAGLALGMLTPLVVLLANALWATGTGLALRLR
ncbi:hypothetical protein [Spongiibacter sp.]|uniref:hypothetical protein n=1 Tax=Spongiibacter sp. TaxID=2024860 RepID=UPI0035688CC5